MDNMGERSLTRVASRLYWVFQLIGWGLNTIAQAYMAMDHVRGPAARLAVEILSINVLALTLTNLLRHLMRRHNWHALGLKAILPRVFLVSISLALLLAAIMQFMAISTLWTGPLELSELTGPVWSWFVQTPLVNQTANWSVLFAAWMVLCLGMTSLYEGHVAELRRSEFTRALHVAELGLLKSQLNPHFLFNSLNNVRALIADDRARAQQAITQLARTVEYTLNASQEDVVTLERELGIVADYLELESLRLGERLRIECHVATEALHAQIPAMLLQTIVENAVKHGIAELPQGGVLRVSATSQQSGLRIEVQNPRPRSSSQSPSLGIGMRNVSERLRLLFGSHATFELDLSRSDSALARICIPQPKYSDDLP